jgi:hypothetical protein
MLSSHREYASSSPTALGAPAQTAHPAPDPTLLGRVLQAYAPQLVALQSQQQETQVFHAVGELMHEQARALVGTCSFRPKRGTRRCVSPADPSTGRVGMCRKHFNHVLRRDYSDPAERDAVREYLSRPRRAPTTLYDEGLLAAAKQHQQLRTQPGVTLVCPDAAPPQRRLPAVAHDTAPHQRVRVPAPAGPSTWTDADVDELAEYLSDSDLITD